MDSKEFVLQDFNFGNQNSKSTPFFTKRDLARILFKHKGIILGIFILTTLIITGVLIYLPAFYKADARILIKTDQIGTPTFFSGIASVKEPLMPDPVERQIADEVELVSARSILAEVVDELNLTYDQIALKPYQYFLDPVVDVYDKLILILLDKKPDPEKRGRNKVIEQLQKSIEVESVAGKGTEVNSNIIEVSLLSLSPEMAKNVLNRLLEFYTAHDVKANQKAGEEAYETVKLRLDEAREDVKYTEKTLKTFLAERGVTRHATMNAVTGASVNVQTADAPAGSPVKGETVITTPRDESTVNILKAQLVETKLELLEYQAKFPPSSPEVTSRVKLINKINEQLSEEIKKSASNEATLINLERELQTAEKTYLELEKRLSEISLFLEVNKFQVSNRIIIAAPVQPIDSEWKKRVGIGAMASLASLLLGMLLAAFNEYTGKNFRSNTEAQQVLGVEVVASLPRINNFPPTLRYGEELPPQLVSQTPMFQRLASQLLFILGGDVHESEEKPAGGAAVYVTSCGRSEGKTVFSVLLARELAPLCHKGVLLVEANFDNPALGACLGIRGAKPGFADLIQGMTTQGPVMTDQAFQSTGFANLFFLGSGTRPATGQLYRQNDINDVSRLLCKEFDVVIYDGGGLNGCGANALLRTADQTIIILESEITRRAVAEKLIKSSGIKTDSGVWAIMNKVIQYLPDSLYRML